MTEYVESSTGLALFALLLLPTLLAIATGATLFTRRWAGHSRSGWPVALTGTFLALTVFVIMLWAPVVPQDSGVDLYCDQAFVAITFHGSSGNVFPEWAAKCQAAGAQHLIISGLLTLVWMGWALVRVGRRSSPGT